jgi:GDP-D-mannose dehydratase
MEKEKTALIAGATGLVGGFCIKLLLESPEYKKIYSLSRREIKIENLNWNRLFLILANLKIPQSMKNLMLFSAVLALR